jgi:predicted nuclease of predicted toxin-antitoxin system
LRFFADHCVSNSIIQALRNAGHEVLRLQDCLSVESEDEEVITKAQELDSILLTLNGDFADIVAFPPSLYKGIIAIQLRNRPRLTPPLMKRLTSYLDSHSTPDDYKGKLLVVEVDRIRIRE